MPILGRIFGKLYIDFRCVITLHEVLIKVSQWECPLSAYSLICLSFWHKDPGFGPVSELNGPGEVVIIAQVFKSSVSGIGFLAQNWDLWNNFFLKFVFQKLIWKKKKQKMVLKYRIFFQKIEMESGTGNVSPSPPTPPTPASPRNWCWYQLHSAANLSIHVV